MQKVVKARKLFIDSGAHTLYNKYVRDKSEREGKEFFSSKIFKRWCTAYGTFIKMHRDEIDVYVNLDKIYDPQVSWDNQKRLEEVYGINPIPVVHHNTPLHWLEKYITAGYEYIGIGGVGQKSNFRTYSTWADQVFRLLCSTPNKMPAAKTHGFAMTSPKLLTRYPWYSVDSSTHRKCAGYGQIRIPRVNISGEYEFQRTPLVCFTTAESQRQFDKKNNHVECFRSTGVNEKNILSDFKKVQQWLEFIGLPYGKVDKDGYLVEWGVTSDYSARILAAVQYTRAVQNSTHIPFEFKKESRPSFTDREVKTFPSLEEFTNAKKQPVTVYFVEQPGASMLVPEEYRHILTEWDTLHSFVLYFNESWSKEKALEKFSVPLRKKANCRLRTIEEQLKKEKEKREKGKKRYSESDKVIQRRQTGVVEEFGILAPRS